MYILQSEYDLCVCILQSMTYYAYVCYRVSITYINVYYRHRVSMTYIYAYYRAGMTYTFIFVYYRVGMTYIYEHYEVGMNDTLVSIIEQR